MSATFKEVLKLPSLKQAKVVAGKQGFNGVIRWVHMAEMLTDICDIIEWTEGQELLIVTGSGIKDEQQFNSFVFKAFHKNIAGLLVFIGEYIKTIPNSVIKQADELGFPIITIPWEVPAVRLTNDICEAIIKGRQKEFTIRSLLEYILFYNQENSEQYISQASLYGYNFNQPHQVIVVDIDHFSEYLKKHKLFEEEEILRLKQRISRLVEFVVKAQESSALCTMFSDSIVCLVPVKSRMHKSKVTKLCEAIHQEIKKHFGDMTGNIGVGSEQSYIANFKKSFEEAQKTLSVLKKKQMEDSTAFYEDLGIDMLLIEFGQNQILKKFYNSVLKNLITYDRTNKSNLLQTLQIYLHENGNANKSAEQLFIHRNTMKYRLDKIQELLDVDINNAEVLFNMRLAFQIEKYIH